jgi:hypothetical protein
MGGYQSMKVKFNTSGKVYSLANSGFSMYSNKLVLTIVKENEVTADIRAAAVGNSQINILDDSGVFKQAIKDFTEFISIREIDDFVISRAIYDEDGNVVKPSEVENVVVVTLGYKESETPVEPDVPADEDEPITLASLAARLDAIFMLLDLALSDNSEEEETEEETEDEEISETEEEVTE